MLCYLGFPFDFLRPIFSEEDPKLLENLMSVSTLDGGIYPIQSSRHSSLFYSGCYVHLKSLVWRRYSRLLVPRFPER